MEPTMEEKLKAVIELCEEGDPEMCAFLGKEFCYGWNVGKPNTGLYLVHILTAVASAVKTLKFYLITGRQPFKKRWLMDGNWSFRSSRLVGVSNT